MSEVMTQQSEKVKITNYNNGSGVPVHFYLDDGLMPDERALNPLEALSKMPEVDEYLVALPDLHYKGRNIVPTGLVTVSKNHIIPFAVDKGINCGIRMMTLPISASEMNIARIDAFYEKVMQRVPAKKHDKPVLTGEEMADAIMGGAEWAVRRFGLPEESLQNFEQYGNLLGNKGLSKAQVLRSIPGSAIKKGRRGMGILGGGNHFLELQQITDVLDEDLAAKLGMKQDQLVLMLHTGTGGLGGAAMKFFHQVRYDDDPERQAHKAQEKAEFLNFEPKDAYREKWMKNPHLYAIPVDSPTAQHFLTACYGIANFGFVNRTAISYHAEQALRETFGDPDFRLNLLYDSSHVTIQQEQHETGTFWVHRNGANQAMPASYMQDHPVFRETGQPIPVPGSMGTDSYIAVAAEGTRKTFCSTNHGAGRLLDKPEARDAFGENDVVETMEKRGIRLYRYGKGEITEQAPDAFKNVDNVLQVMQRFNIANPVVKVHPLAVLKG